MIELKILTRRDCDLCEEMKAVAERFVASAEVTLVEVDVDADRELAGRWGGEVPVLFVDGRLAFKYRVSDRELRRRLAAERRRALARRLRRLVGSPGGG